MLTQPLALESTALRQRLSDSLVTLPATPPRLKAPLFSSLLDTYVRIHFVYSNSCGQWTAGERAYASCRLLTCACHSSTMNVLMLPISANLSGAVNLLRIEFSADHFGHTAPFKLSEAERGDVFCLEHNLGSRRVRIITLTPGLR